jgi:hypothetical protein
MSLSFSFDHCRVIITGASSGLGTHYAKALVYQAQALLLIARRHELLESLKQTLLSLNPNLQVHCLALDLTSPNSISELIEWISVHQFKPNLLINNAGMGDYGSLTSAEWPKIKTMMDLNMTSLTEACQRLPEYLQKSPQYPAAILNVSSLAGEVPVPNLAVYAATKAFVTHLSQALNVELEAANILVCHVSPGPTPTGFSKTAKRDDGDDTNRSGQDWLVIPPEQVVLESLNALKKGKAWIFPGSGVKFAANLFRLLPRKLRLLILKRRYSNEVSAP